MAELMDCTNIYLKSGSKGDKVKTLQTNLKALGYYTTSGKTTLKVDGSYGPYTVDAVKKLQGALGGLKQDGEFGPVTCKKTNEKLQADKKVTASGTTTKKTATTKKVVIIDPYAPNTKKNVLKAKESNLSIDGLFFLISSITPTNVFHGGNWKSLELMSGKTKDYLSTENAYEYSVDCYITNEDYITLYDELEKIGKRACKVISPEIQSGLYKISVTVANEKLSHKKITFKMSEFRS